MYKRQYLNRLKDKGISIAEVTLHVGPGTFQPVECETIENHVMHNEWFEISSETTEAINQTIKNGNRIIAVGTTTMRVLESTAKKNDLIKPQQNRTNIFIHPPYNFRIVDALLTNFHLPKSSLFILIASFVGLEVAKKIYLHAIKNDYRFFSYGDGSILFRKF